MYSVLWMGMTLLFPRAAPAAFLLGLPRCASNTFHLGKKKKKPLNSCDLWLREHPLGESFKKHTLSAAHLLKHRQGEQWRTLQRQIPAIYLQRESRSKPNALLFLKHQSQQDGDVACCDGDEHIDLTIIDEMKCLSATCCIWNSVNHYHITFSLGRVFG